LRRHDELRLHCVTCEENFLRRWSQQGAGAAAFEPSEIDGQPR
jgi:hypothetical protein